MATTSARDLFWITARPAEVIEFAVYGEQAELRWFVNRFPLFACT